MSKLLEIAPYALPIATIVIGYFLGRKKTKAETKCIEVKTKSDEVDLDNKIINFYKSQTEDVLQEVTELRGEVAELKEFIKELIKNQCKGDNCQDRIEYNKILAKRESRKRAVKKKKSEIE
jgi:hypothetical protein